MVSLHGLGFDFDGWRERPSVHDLPYVFVRLVVRIHLIECFIVALFRNFAFVYHAYLIFWHRRFHHEKRHFRLALRLAGDQGRHRALRRYVVLAGLDIFFDDGFFYFLVLVFYLVLRLFHSDHCLIVEVAALQAQVVLVKVMMPTHQQEGVVRVAAARELRKVVVSDGGLRLR